MYKTLYISPMIPTFAMRDTAAFFIDVLGFVQTFQSDWYTIVEKDNLTIHFLRAGEDIGQMELYMEVDNVDALWQTIKDKLVGITHKPPFNREYMMREIHIAVPHTNTLLFIGQSIT